MRSPSPAPLSFPCYDGRIHVFSLPNETNDDIAKPSIYILYVYEYSVLYTSLEGKADFLLDVLVTSLHMCTVQYTVQCTLNT